MGPDSLNLNLDLLGIPVIGDVISGINSAITAVNSAVSDLISGLNSFVQDTLDAVVNPFISAVDSVVDVINVIPGVDITPIGEVSLTIPSIPEIPSIPTDIASTIDLPSITEPGVPAYVWDMAQNEMAILGSIASLAAPVAGTVSSDGIGNFLAPDAIMNFGFHLRCDTGQHPGRRTAVGHRDAAARLGEPGGGEPRQPFHAT